MALLQASCWLPDAIGLLAWSQANDRDPMPRSAFGANGLRLHKAKVRKPLSELRAELRVEAAVVMKKTPRPGKFLLR